MVNFDNFDLLMEINFQCKEVSATLTHCNKLSVLHHHCNYYVTGWSSHWNRPMLNHTCVSHYSEYNRLVCLKETCIWHSEQICQTFLPCLPRLWICCYQWLSMRFFFNTITHIMCANPLVLQLASWIIFYNLIISLLRSSNQSSLDQAGLQSWTSW